LSLNVFVRFHCTLQQSEDFSDFDPILSQSIAPGSNILPSISGKAILEIEDIAAYNQSEGLAKSRRSRIFDNLAVKIGEN
jgi:phosphoribosylformylglycinamidine synthase